MGASKKTKARSATREKLLQAAAQVIIDRGVEALTLDAVAQQADVSKGGLLYHFLNKNALIVNVGQQQLQNFEAALQQEFEQDDAPGTPGQWTRAYVRSAERTSKESLALIARLSSILVEMPSELLQSVEAYEQRWHQRLESDGLDPVQATIIQLAIDGLWFSEAFQMAVPREERRTQIVETLLAMTRSPQ
ncbi:TetR/AcrR family transcriptional regulator [cf. Phormidesmis sp. LEGE 11477]|uniref:TetR/AcrR family transcriptional regulator n=1 Tax=cf. Phormidesmis sp. LEGE 11477 TaxID=1828680 RepID=UPI0018819E8D|nr:TetR/AcrR family transcriptional regulator [cf. Phormidesmis sp. LEGE 11477]MBE9063414.1 TetR family transcriptional regulator [cf. Phormidesmis sp. LEGE 11477]